MANKAQWYYSTRENRWRLSGKAGASLLEVGDNGQLIHKGTTRVESVATFHTLLNVGTQILSRALNIAEIATIGQSLNVGTLATLEKMRIGGKHYLSRILTAVGTSPNTNAPTLSIAIANLSGIGSLGIDVGDIVLVHQKDSLAGGNAGYVGHLVPTTNVIEVHMLYASGLVGGSIVAAGWDILVFKASTT